MHDINIEHIAKLAKLFTPKEKKAAYQEEFKRIIAMVEHINTLDTDEVEPLAHPFEATQRLREDQITEAEQRELFQAIAPQVEAGLYLVPPVIAKQEQKTGEESDE